MRLNMFLAAAFLIGASAPARALMATVTVHFQNNEEKTFSFANDGKPHPLDIKSKLFLCSVDFKENLAKISCAPFGSKEPYFRLIQAASLCSASSLGNLGLSGGPWRKKTPNESYTITIVCSQ